MRQLCPFLKGISAPSASIAAWSSSVNVSTGRRSWAGHRVAQWHSRVPGCPPQPVPEQLKKHFTSDLETGTVVDDVFFIRQVEEKTARTGRKYLKLSLSDRTGIAAARAWDVTEGLRENLAGDTFARIRGRVESYRRQPQLVIERAEKVSSAGLDQRDFLPSTYCDLDELSGFLEYFITEVFDEDYTRLLESFFRDQRFMERFRLAPGDIRSHHAYLGGLMEHTVSVATLCQHTVVQHPRLNRDQLTTAALLHDIGKVDEFICDGRIRYSREGKLLGHVLIGQRMIESRMQTIGDFPGGKGLELLHVVISHHGELEWGAPKLPQSAEALVLHHLDNLDAKIKGYFEIVEGRGDVSWPEMQNLFRRPLSEPRAADRDRKRKNF